MQVVAVPRNLYETLRSLAIDCAEVRTQLSRAAIHTDDAEALVNTASQLRDVERAIECVLVAQDERTES